MKLTFIGADHEVTGSCHMLSVGDKTVIVDCGMEQGPDLYENQQIPVKPVGYRRDPCDPRAYRSHRSDPAARKERV